MTSNFGYLMKLPELDISSRLLQTSIDVLCLLEIGSLHQDERCLREARTLYVKALHMLSRELAQPKPKQIRSDHLLAAITMLALCELFDPLASNSQKRKGWLSHIEGAQQYLIRNRTECMASPLGRLLVHNIRHSSLCMGYSNRKAVMFAEPGWLKLTRDISKTDSFIHLYDLAIQIPGILERADLICSRPETTRVQTQFCNDIAALRLKLTEWSKMYHLAESEPAYKIVNVRDMECFAHLCLDRTFQTAFRFQNVQVCNQMQLYWISCMFLDCTLLEIGRRAELSGLAVEDIERQIFVTATNFCRSIPYCCELETGSVSRLGNFFLSSVERYFEHHGHCNEAEWCKSVRRILDSSPPVTKDATAPDNMSTARIETAQANVRHRCKSPICNFRVECCAPAPLLMVGEYPDVDRLHNLQ